jgi:hypothetical protein
MCSDYSIAYFLLGSTTLLSTLFRDRHPFFFREAFVFYISLHAVPGAGRDVVAAPGKRAPRSKKM